MLAGLCLTADAAVARPDTAALTAPQAVAAVKAVLRAKATRCGTRVVRVSATRSTQGWKVTAVTAGGAPGTSLWAVVKAARPLNPLARKIVAGCPRTPAPAPPAPPAPPTPGAPASYTFGADLTASQQVLVRRGLDAGARYYRSALGRDLPAFEVWAFTKLEDIVAAYSASAPDSAERARALWSGGQVGHALTRKVWLGPKWFENTQQAALKIAAHEAFHLLQYELVGERALGVSGLDEVPRAGPWWLAEGAAEYFAYLALVADGSASLTGVRAQWRDAARASTATLQDLATLRGQRETPRAYDIYALAVELLVRDREPKLVLAFYETLAGGTDWPSAFTATFGRTAAAFASEFESYRRSF